MRIVYLFDQVLPKSATDTEQTINMVSALGAAGAEVDVVLPRPWGQQGPTVDELATYYGVEPTFRIHVVPSAYPAPRGLEKPAHAIVAALSQVARRADVIYTRNIPGLLAAGRLTDRPLVFEHYRPWPDQNPFMARLFARLAKSKRAPRLVLHSALAEASYQRVGFRPQDTLVAHNGWDPRRMDPVLDQTEARRRVDLVGDAPIVLYAGHINPRKGIGLLLDLAEAFPQARVVLVGSEGDGPIERRAANLPNVVVRGWVKPAELVPYLYAADILAIPPTAKPLEVVGNTVLPMKTFLYMASQRAIFGPDTPDLREVLRDDHNASLVAPDDPAAARQRLGRLLGDVELRRRLGDAARLDATAMTWRNRAERVLAFIEGGSR